MLRTDLLTVRTLVPAIPPETLSKLEEDQESSDSTDDFQNVRLGNLQQIQELTDYLQKLKSGSLTNEDSDPDNIPDIETFNEQNIIISEDPVRF